MKKQKTVPKVNMDPKEKMEHIKQNLNSVLSS